MEAGDELLSRVLDLESALALLLSASVHLSVRGDDGEPEITKTVAWTTADRLLYGSDKN